MNEIIYNIIIIFIAWYFYICRLRENVFRLKTKYTFALKTIFEMSVF